MSEEHANAGSDDCLGQDQIKKERLVFKYSPLCVFDGTVITIVCIRLEDKFTVKVHLMANNDTVLNIKLNGESNCFTSTIGSDWPAKFDLKNSDAFCLTIATKSNTFDIGLNGKSLHCVEHQTPLEDISWLRITEIQRTCGPSVQIQQVSVKGGQVVYFKSKQYEGTLRVIPLHQSEDVLALGGALTKMAEFKLIPAIKFDTYYLKCHDGRFVGIRKGGVVAVRNPKVDDAVDIERTTDGYCALSLMRKDDDAEKKWYICGTEGCGVVAKKAISIAEKAKFLLVQVGSLRGTGSFGSNNLSFLLQEPTVDLIQPLPAPLKIVIMDCSEDAVSFGPGRKSYIVSTHHDSGTLGRALHEKVDESDVVKVSMGTGLSKTALFEIELPTSSEPNDNGIFLKLKDGKQDHYLVVEDSEVKLVRSQGQQGATKFAVHTTASKSIFQIKVACGNTYLAANKDGYVYADQDSKATANDDKFTLVIFAESSDERD